MAINISIKDFRVKVSLVVSAALLIFLAAFSFSGYIYDFNTLRDTTGAGQKEMARLMADNISGLIDKEIELEKSSAASDIIHYAVKESNSKQPPDEKAAQRYLEDMDKKWIEVPDDHSLIREFTDNKVSARLKATLGMEAKTVNILVTNRFGALVAATSRTSDFYQGNKDWWKGSYNGGDPRPYIGNVVYDEKKNIWCVPFVVPIKDRAGEFIGIYRSLKDINFFFKPLEEFKLGETGWASLVDDKGYLIYQPLAKPFANKFCGYEELRKIQEGRRGWFVIDGVYGRPSKVFISSSEISHKLFVQGGLKWRVFITQEAREVFAPLNRLLIQTLAIGIILVLLAAGFTFIITDVFMGPVRRMREGIDRIARGELDYRIESDNEVQLKGLAASINNMVVTLKTWAAPIANLDKEIYQRKKAQDKLHLVSSGFASALSALMRPLASLKDGFKLIMEEEPKAASEKHKKAVGATQESVEIVSGSLDKLLDVARIEAGSIELNRKSVDIRTLLRAVIFEFEPKIRDKGLDFKLDAPKEAVNVFVDHDKIAKVFNNLMENAVKFTEKGYIELAVRELKDDVECSITDTGVGIPRENILHVFDEFQHLDQNPAVGDSSPGVGLAIVKEILEMHNGKIWVESKPGEMTKFTFRLPKKPSS